MEKTGADSSAGILQRNTQSIWKNLCSAVFEKRIWRQWVGGCRDCLEDFCGSEAVASAAASAASTASSTAATTAAAAASAAVRALVVDNP